MIGGGEGVVLVLTELSSSSVTSPSSGRGGGGGVELIDPLKVGQPVSSGTRRPRIQQQKDLYTISPHSQDGPSQSHRSSLQFWIYPRGRRRGKTTGLPADITTTSAKWEIRRRRRRAGHKKPLPVRSSPIFHSVVAWIRIAMLPLRYLHWFRRTPVGRW